MQSSDGSKALFFIIIVIFLVGQVPVFGQSKNMEDVVYLKNGSIIRGTITEQITGESLKIETKDGSIFVFADDEIDHIAKEEIKGAILEKSKEPTGKRKSPATAGILSFVLPGGGQFYNGEYTKGVIQLGIGLTGFVIYLNGVLNLKFDEDINTGIMMGGLLCLATMIWSIFDAISSAERINRENGWAIAPPISENLYLTFSDFQINQQTTPGVKLILKF